ncbi:MAG: hypothetical protein ACXWAT_00310 [Methylobacter sp.]
MNHTKIIEVMKEIQSWRFILMWVWLMVLAVTPITIAFITYIK